jgi:hypothetical protein
MLWRVGGGRREYIGQMQRERYGLNLFWALPGEEELGQQRKTSQVDNWFFCRPCRCAAPERRCFGYL